MKITIETAGNGYIMKTYDLEEKENGAVEESVMDHMVFEETEWADASGEEYFNTKDGSNVALGHLLYAVAEAVGYSDDRFGSDNLKITFGNKGSKVD